MALSFESDVYTPFALALRTKVRFFVPFRHVTENCESPDCRGVTVVSLGLHVMLILLLSFCYTLT